MRSINYPNQTDNLKEEAVRRIIISHSQLMKMEEQTLAISRKLCRNFKLRALRTIPSLDLVQVRTIILKLSSISNLLIYHKFKVKKAQAVEISKVIITIQQTIIIIMKINAN